MLRNSYKDAKIVWKQKTLTLNIFYILLYQLKLFCIKDVPLLQSMTIFFKFSIPLKISSHHTKLVPPKQDLIQGFIFFLKPSARFIAKSAYTWSPCPFLLLTNICQGSLLAWKYPENKGHIIVIFNPQSPALQPLKSLLPRTEASEPGFSGQQTLWGLEFNNRFQVP